MPYLDIPNRQLHMFYVINSLDSPDDPQAHVLDPNKKNLVLIHAPFSSSENFTAQFSDPRLVNAFNLIGFDARLHGRTKGADRPTHKLEDSANCIIAAIDQLDLNKFTVVGESFHGANIAAIIATKRPEQVSALVLVSPSWLREPESITKMMLEEWLPLASVNKDGKGDASGTIPDEQIQVYGDYFFSGVARLAERREAFMENLQKRYGSGHNTHDIAHLASFFGREPLPASALASIKAPVLILQGGADTISSPVAAAEQWRDALKSARGGADLRVLAGAPHLLLFTDFSIANRFILQFVSRST